MVRTAAASGAALAIWLTAGAVPAAGASTRPPEPAATLDVPYVPQPPDLCGGAAVAMVFRYWGERGLSPGEFAPLVRREAAGIPTRALTEAVRQRGWAAHPFAGTAESVAHHLARGRPIIALIAIRPGRYHYVVVLAWRDEAVTVHDPAIAPARAIAPRDFETAWAAAGRWSLLVLPDGTRDRAPATPSGKTTAADAGGAAAALPTACAPAVTRGVAHAREQAIDLARTAFEEAHRACPLSSAPLREMAGLALLERRPDEAAALAARAVALDAHDEHAWRLLATSRFLLRDRPGALAAWNQVAEPRVDLVQVNGLARTRYRVVADRIETAPGRVLTPDALAHAERRLAELPTVRAARVGYRPVSGGLADVEAAIVERPMAPLALPQAAAIGVRAAVSREVRYAVASPLGAGELWHVGWRFWASRPAISGGLQVPSAIGPVRGVLGLTGGWEEQTYATGPGTEARERRRAVRVSLADWATSRVRWEVGAGADQWDGRGRLLTLDGSLGVRFARDRAGVTGSVQQWLGGDRFGAVELSADWTSGRDRSAPSWLAAGTVAATGNGSPLGTWQGAGTGHGRRPLLRAHPLLDGGVIDGAVFGRRIAHATLERRQPLGTTGPLALQLAAFADTARHWHGLRPGTLQVDAGVGLRVRVPGEGTLRIDVARGLRSGGTVVSAGWVPH